MELETRFSPITDIPVFGYTYIGILGIKDLVHPGLRESFALCPSAGVDVRIVTNDNINIATAIARE